MYSYFCLIAPHALQHERLAHLTRQISQTLPEYAMAWQADGVVFLHAGLNEPGIRTCQLDGNAGVIAGTLFKRDARRHGVPVQNRINPPDSARIIATSGRHLTENFWGRYTAFLRKADNDTICIVRDPTGVMPAYYHEADGIYVFFSDAEHFAALGLARLSPNYAHLAAHLCQPFFDNADTGLNEVEKVLPGHCLSISDQGREHRVYWHPADFCRADRHRSDQEAAELIKQAVMECTHAWAAEFKSVILRLSGGFDSSVVLACLARAPQRPEITGVHYFSDGIGSDERHFAQGAAEAAQVPVVYRKETPENVDLTYVAELAPRVEPVSVRFAIAKGRFEKELLDEAGAEAFFTGEGGDGLFYSPPFFYIEDYVHRNGLGGKLLEHVANGARASDSSFWATLRRSLSVRFKRPGKEAIQHLIGDVHPLLTADVAATTDVLSRCDHWLDRADDLSIGKIFHLANSRPAIGHRMPNARRNEVSWINPLFSQPVWELVLSLPVYQLSLGGYDRGLARKAFRGLAPDANILRHSKGGIQTLNDGVFERHIPFLRSYLLDGLLVREKILDRSKVEHALKGDLSQGYIARNKVIGALGAEAWLRYWAH